MTIPSTSNPAADAAYRRFRRTGDAAAIADLFDLAAADLHRTAMHLVGDDATAHDLVQVTFLAALQQRDYDERRPVLPWLAGILRHQAALVHRRRAHGFDRDRLRAEPTEDPAAMAMASETLAEVESALAQLPAVYQPVIRLHVLHGLDAAAIAASLQRPGGTVRTQIVRGLEQLRQLLPVGIAGVLAGLLPNVGHAAVRAAVLEAAQSSAMLAAAGVIGRTALPLRRGPMALLLGGTLAIVAAVVMWPREIPPPVVDARAAALPTNIESPKPVAASPSDAVATSQPSRREHATTTGYEVRGAVRGTVRGIDGQPVAGAEVMLWKGNYAPHLRGDRFEPPPVAVVATTADGTFAIRGQSDACYLFARAPGMWADRGINGEPGQREIVEGLEFTLVPLLEQKGRIVDADGRGVAGQACTITSTYGISSANRLPTPGFTLADPPTVEVTADADGAFVCELASRRRWSFEVLHPRHPMLRQSHEPERGPVELQLERGEEIRGRVWLPDGSPAVGAEIVLRDYPTRRARCDERGAFTVAGASMRTGLWLAVEQPQMAVLCAPVTDTATELRLRLEPARALRGRVVDAAGRPVAGAEVRVVGDRTIDTGATYGEPSTWEFVTGNGRATTAADGAFAFERLYDGLFALDIKLATGVEMVPLGSARSGGDDVVLRLPAMAVVVGELRDELTRQPIEAATLTVSRRNADGGWIGFSRELAAPGGLFRIDDLGTGAVRLDFAVPGYARLSLPPRELTAGEQRIDVALSPERHLEVEVRGADGAASGNVYVHLGDGVRLQLPVGLGLRMDRSELRDGRAHLEGLPARLVFVAMDRRGQPPFERQVDLTTQPVAPLVIDLADVPSIPIAELGILVLHCAAGFDAATLGAPTERTWLRRAMTTPGIAAPTGKVTIRVRDGTGAEVAHGVVEPRARRKDGAADAAEAQGGLGRFHCASSNADGTGESTDDSPVPAISVRAALGDLTIVAEAEGRVTATRRIAPRDLTDGRGQFALFLPPR